LVGLGLEEGCDIISWPEIRRPFITLLLRWGIAIGIFKVESREERKVYKRCWVVFNHSSFFFTISLSLSLLSFDTVVVVPKIKSQ
jgi:hypothetical protein